MKLGISKLPARTAQWMPSAILVACAFSAVPLGFAQSGIKSTYPDPGSPALSEATCNECGLLTVGSHTIEMKPTGFVLMYQQSLESTEGDPKAVDAALASMQSTLSTITGEVGVAAGATRMERVRSGSAREGGYFSKSRGGGEIGSATWVVRVPDRSAVEAMLVRTAPLGKQLSLQGIQLEMPKVDTAARQAALASAGSDALKTAEAIVSQTNSKIGRLLHARDSSMFNASVMSIDAADVFVFGKRVWMPETPNPSMTFRLECRFEILAK